MPDDTLQLDTPAKLLAPQRVSVKLTETARPDDPAVSPADETFGEGSLRIHLDEDEQTLIAQHLDRVLGEIKTTRENRGWDADWDLYEDAYFGLMQDRPYGQSNVHIPMTQEIVDAVDAVLDQALFTPNPWLGVQPREAMMVDVVKRREQFLDYALKVEMHAQERIEPIRFETEVLGTGVGFLPWLRELDRIRDQETYDGHSPQDMQRFVDRYGAKAEEDFPEVVKKLRAGEKITVTVEYSEAIHDAPDLTYIPVRNWIVRDTAQWDRLHREPFVGHKIEALRWDELLEWEEREYYDAKTTDRMRFQINADTKASELVQDYERKTYEIITGILRWRRKGETRERRYLVDYHQSSRTICRMLTYPYWHNRVNYIPFYLQRSRKYIYGLSLVQKIMHPQQEADAIHSLLLDIVAFTGLPMFMARKGSEMQFNPLRDGMYPGKTFYLNNPQGDVQRLEAGSGNGISQLLTLEQVASRHGELASGATQNLSGLESSRDPQAPATKTLQETQSALRRIGRYLTTFGSSLVELGFQVCELYYQFAPPGKVYRVMGEEGVPVFPQLKRDELRLRVDYYPHGSTSTLNPDIEHKQDVEVAGVLTKIVPGIAQDPVKSNALAETLLDSAGPLWQQKKHKFLLTSQELERYKRAKKLKDQVDEMRLKQAEANPQALMQPQATPGGAPPGGVAPPGASGGAPSPQLPPAIAQRVSPNGGAPNAVS